MIAKYHIAVDVVSQSPDLVFEHSSITEFEQAYAIVRRARDHWAEGRDDTRDHDMVTAPRPSWWLTEQSLERVAKSRLRFKSMIVGCSRRRFAVTNPAQCLADSARTLIRVKRHAVVGLEPPADANGVDAGLPEVGVCPTT
jgi:hypothetical protein